MDGSLSQCWKTSIQALRCRNSDMRLKVESPVIGIALAVVLGRFASTSSSRQGSEPFISHSILLHNPIISRAFPPNPLRIIQAPMLQLRLAAPSRNAKLREASDSSQLQFHFIPI